MDVAAALWMGWGSLDVAVDWCLNDMMRWDGRVWLAVATSFVVLVGVVRTEHRAHEWAERRRNADEQVVSWAKGV